MTLFCNMMNRAVQTVKKLAVTTIDRGYEAYNARINKWISCAKVNPLFQCEQREDDVPHGCMSRSHDVYCAHR